MLVSSAELLWTEISHLDALPGDSNNNRLAPTAGDQATAIGSERDHITSDTDSTASAGILSRKIAVSWAV